MVDRVRAITGRIDLVHANDCKDTFDSGADRHANFGAGNIDPTNSRGAPRGAARRSSWRRRAAPKVRARTSPGCGSGCRSEPALMRIATWNVDDHRPRSAVAASGWSHAPDVLALQETRSPSEFPTAEVEALGYQVAAHGEGRWNGVAMLSKVGLDDVVRGLKDGPGPRPGGPRGLRDLRRPGCSRCTCPRSRAGLEHYAYKWRGWKPSAPQWPPDATETGLAVMGDLNARPDDDARTARLRGLHPCH